ncbi:olfactory receptor 5AR1-like [Rhea pennata]|uniref:olfactory receptor 5AR1-like n=1 Tax=Rhea pennata TaxID=8795 RepID=UPI002E25D177
MDRQNHTIVTEFILLGLTDHPTLQVPLFIIFLVVYIATLMGNIGMILLVISDAHLHTPMYFFLSHLSLVDICYSSSIVPKMLANFLSETKVISLSSCAVQMSLFLNFVVTESFLLAVMAYDRYVAICNPLLYMLIMSRKLCICLVAASYLCGIVCSLIHTYSAFQLSFCGPDTINHFFCDVSPVLALACSDTYINEVLLVTFATFVEASTIIIILTSYTVVILAVLRIRSKEGKYKALSTCASHLMVITLFHGTVLFMYCQPNHPYSMDTDKITSVFYTVVIPMLNPLIYSLRNTEVRDSLGRF